MLHKVLRHHHIAHLHTFPHTAGHPGEDDARSAQALDQRAGGGGCCHLANAAERQHHRLAMQQAVVEHAPGVQGALGLLQVGEQTGLFFGQGAEDGGGHGCCCKSDSGV